MASFVQFIEMQMSRVDEVEALIREPPRGIITADRDRRGFYLSAV
jgi:hypothetical protein